MRSKALIVRAFLMISKKDRFKLSAMGLVQVALGLLDLIGIAAIGALGALAITGIQSRQPGNRVGGLLQSLGIENFSLQGQAAIIGIFAVVTLLSRTLLSIFFSRRALFFLGRRGAQISAELVSKSLSRSYLGVHSRSSQETLYATTNGVEAITLGVLGTGVIIAADISALFFLTVGLLIIDTSIAISSFLIFAIVGFTLYRLLHVRAKILGQKNVSLVLQSNTQVLEVVNSYREALVHNRLDFHSKQIGKTRQDLADTLAELNFLPNISKYVLESTVLLSALFVGASQFLLQDASRATATLSVFLAAATRIAPAVLRVQQGSLLIKSNLAKSEPTFRLLDELQGIEKLPESSPTLDLSHTGFKSDISATSVFFTYPGAQDTAISDINLTLSTGTLTAIVGPSGAGKSTLVDVMLGVLEPDQGSILISGESPKSSFVLWPGAISYVPQDVRIIDGSIRQNVALGYPVQMATDALVWSALEVAQLSDTVASLGEGLDSQVGENGIKLSGGQKQRLGIARAMFTRPKLLFLDEATSSLDGETEAAISRSINSLKGDVTVVLIAHRLSTVRDADRIIYVEGGSITAAGTFEQVRGSVPNFDKQAKLMGL